MNACLDCELYLLPMYCGIQCKVYHHGVNLKNSKSCHKPIQNLHVGGCMHNACIMGYLQHENTVDPVLSDIQKCTKQRSYRQVVV